TGGSLAAAIGFLAVAVLALVMLGRTALAQEAEPKPAAASNDAETSTAAAPSNTEAKPAAAPNDAGPGVAGLPADAIGTDAGPRHLLDRSVFLPKASQRLLNLRTVVTRSSQ